MDYFNPINARIEGTGALFNSSKKHFIWKFELDSEENSVELECSFLTNKRRVTFNGRLIFKGMKPLLTSDFQYQFKHNNHIITVFNHRNDANLLVDSLNFDLIYSQKILKRANLAEKIETRPAAGVSSQHPGPKPARFISDEEFNAAVQLSKDLEPAKKLTLNEILEKNKPLGRESRDFFEEIEEKAKVENNTKDLDTKNKNFQLGEDFLNIEKEIKTENFAEQKNSNWSGKVLRDDFLELDDKEEGLNELLDLEKDAKNDLLDLGKDLKISDDFLESGTKAEVNPGLFNAPSR